MNERAMIDRRDFFTGLGAIIVSAAIPIEMRAALSTPARVLPTIARRMPLRWGPLTYDYLFAVIRDMFEQVADMSDLRLTKNELIGIAADIDNVLWEIKPPGLLILMETSLDDMISGHFAIVERDIGIVAVVHWDAPRRREVLS